MISTFNHSSQGLSNDNTNINERESDSTINIHENDNSRKSYPQRNNRTKLNYRDLERGMYEEIRQSMWALDTPKFMNKNNQRYHDDDDDDDEDVIDLSIDDDDDEESTSDADQMHRRLWCICKKPWDHSRLMLRCDSCANWYHEDCIGINKEKAKAIDINGDQFICLSCQGMSYPIMKRAKSSKESIPTKRKRSDGLSSTRENGFLSKSVSHDESIKTPKSNTSLQRDSLTDLPTPCIVHDCNNLSKSNWVYCSPACIRRHINDRLQAIQQSKGMDNVDIPTSDDILLYENKSKKILEKNSVPKIEDLCTWINQHPSYEIIKPSLRQSILLAAKQSKDSIRPFSDTTKSKPSLTSVAAKQKTTIPDKKSSIQLRKPISTTISNVNNTADIRSKVPTALYDKIIMRLEKSGEKDLIKQDIRNIVNKIEEEMFRVYGKVDNSYKNKFRSLLANISNMNNNFFYKQILSKELTAKEIVAMKAEDMLPPEEKEKRKDQFEKEVQMIINAEQQTAEELARRVRMKKTRQGFVDNDAHQLPIFNSKEQNSAGEEVEKSKNNQPMEKSLEIKPITSITNTKMGSDNQRSSSIVPKSLPPTSVTKKMDSNQSSKLPITEESNPVFSVVDLDNDYIEPESPTGIDALIYDDDDNDDDLNNTNTTSRPSSSHSSIENTELILPKQQIIRDDYNPSKAKTETTPIIRLPSQWRGVIHPPDIKLPCQSVHVYGESDHLINHIPEQLVILGRLRLGDLWDYIRDSLSVRDVLILTLISSSLNTNDNEIFLQYVDTIHTSGRAAVINKCTNSSLIRDMYILAADTKECPSSVLSSLFLPITFESKQLFLVIIGSGKRPIKSINRSNENQSVNNFIYKPVVLQDSTITRDPRLLKSKDPRLNRSNPISENLTLLPPPPIHPKQTSVRYSNEDLLKLMSDSLERIRHSSTADGIRSIEMSTLEIFKANRRDDLCARFTTNFRITMTEWQATHRTTSISTSTAVTGDNLIEENMDVDDEQDDKHKKPVITSSTSNSTSEFNDIDYRFLDQDMDRPITTVDSVNNHQKQRRKSRFSDLVPTNIDRTKPSKLNISNSRVFSKEEKDRSTFVNPAFPIDNAKIASPELEDKYINSSFSSKFRPIINSTESFIPTRNNRDTTSIRFSSSKEPLRGHKPNISSTKDYHDVYGNSPEFSEDLIKQARTYDGKSSSFSDDNWTKQTSSINPIRSTTAVNLIIQQQKTKNRFSSNTNEWRSSSSNNNHMTYYHDFDQPQE